MLHDDMDAEALPAPGRLDHVEPDQRPRAVGDTALQLIKEGLRCGPAEFVDELVRALGWRARGLVREALQYVAASPELTRAERGYLETTLASHGIDAALRGEGRADREHRSTIDDLLRRGELYRSSSAFREMVKFTARFRTYSPYNNMLVRIQNPLCEYYATERDWHRRFHCALKPDARPMLILAPMHPVMTVYDLESVENPPTPEHLHRWSESRGRWEPAFLERMVTNAGREMIRVLTTPQPMGLAGFVRPSRLVDAWKMEVVLRAQLDEPSRFASLCHELAHVYLGHLSADPDGWWPCRSDLPHDVLEIEAESVAYIVTARLGLETESHRYLAVFARHAGIPRKVSVELITKVAGHIEAMATRSVPARARKTKKKGGRGRQVDEV